MQQKVETKLLLGMSGNMVRLSQNIEDSVSGMCSELTRMLDNLSGSYLEYSYVQSAIQQVRVGISEVLSQADSLDGQLRKKAKVLIEVFEKYEETERELKKRLSTPVSFDLPKTYGAFKISPQRVAELISESHAKPDKLTLTDMGKMLWTKAKMTYLSMRLQPYLKEPRTAELYKLMKEGSPLMQEEAIQELLKIEQAFRKISRAQVAYEIYSAYGNEIYGEEVHQQAEKYREILREAGVSESWIKGDLRAFYSGSSITACDYDPRLTDRTVMPTELWSKEDGSLSRDQQMALLVLTNQYFNALDAEQREVIRKLASDIREGKVNPYTVFGNRWRESDIVTLMQSLQNRMDIFPDMKQSIFQDSGGFALFADPNLASRPEEVRQALLRLNADLQQGERDYWNSGVFTEEDWWENIETLNQAVQSLAAETQLNNGISMVDIPSGNKMKAIQHLIGAKETGTWDEDTKAAMQKMLEKSGIEGGASYITPDMLNTILDRYSQGLQDDSIKWGQVGAGVFQTLGGALETVFGAGVATTTGVTGVGVVSGGMIMMHGGSNFTGGISRIVNGLKGSNAGDTANFSKNLFREIGGETGVNIYNGIDLAMAVSGPMDLFAKTIYKSPAAAIDAYKVSAASRNVGVVDGTRQGGSKIPSWIDEMGPEEVLRYQKYWDEASKSKTLTQKGYTELLEDAYYARRNSGLTEPSLPKGSKPYGNYADGDTYGIIKQNETSNTLANQGYEVRMLDEFNGGNGFGVTPNKNPDFLIENKVFDCYAPKPNANVRNIINEIKNKTKEQAQRVVLNLDGFPTDKVDEIVETIIRKANPNGDLKNLSELLIVQDEKIIRVYGGR